MKKLNCVLLTIAILTILLSMTACSNKTIDVQDYLLIEANGLDTAGTVKYKLELENLVQDNLGAFGLETINQPEAISVIMSLDKSLTGSIDKVSGLKNGDEVVFHWDTAGLENLEKQYNVEFNQEDVTYIVSGLKAAEHFNPFDYLIVTFDGIGPNASIRMTTVGEMPVSGIRFNADKNYNLDNGETVCVTFGEADCEERCFRAGYIPEITQKTYTVEGLDSYLKSLEDLSEDAFQKMDKHAQEVLTAKVASWDDPSDLVNIELLGNYLLTPKDPSITTFTHNMLYFIYRITVRDRTENASTKSVFHYYYYSSYDNIIVLADNTCSFNLGSMHQPTGFASIYGEYGEYFMNGDQDYGGYRDLDSLFNKHVATQLDKYKYESTVEIP